MRTVRLLILLLTVLVPISFGVGCSHIKSTTRTSKIGRSQRERNQSEIDLNSLWRQGYGFGNPNKQRMRDGLDPVNINGKTDKESLKSLPGDLVIGLIEALFS